MGRVRGRLPEEEGLPTREQEGRGRLPAAHDAERRRQAPTAIAVRPAGDRGDGDPRGRGRALQHAALGLPPRVALRRVQRRRHGSALPRRRLPGAGQERRLPEQLERGHLRRQLPRPAVRPDA